MEQACDPLSADATELEKLGACDFSSFFLINPQAGTDKSPDTQGR